MFLPCELIRSILLFMTLYKLRGNMYIGIKPIDNKIITQSYEIYIKLIHTHWIMYI
jgi:hypothetical protein